VCVFALPKPHRRINAANATTSIAHDHDSLLPARIRGLLSRPVPFPVVTALAALILSPASSHARRATAAELVNLLFHHVVPKAIRSPSQGPGFLSNHRPCGQGTPRDKVVQGRLAELVHPAHELRLESERELGRGMRSSYPCDRQQVWQRSRKLILGSGCKSRHERHSRQNCARGWT
jgi:hypothetical protein